MSGIPTLYDEHDPEDLPAELQPLPGLDWSALGNRTVQRVVDAAPDAMLTGVPARGRLLRGMLALGIGVRHDGEVVPTVAALVAFGRRPHEVLPAMALEVSVDGGVPQQRSGPVGVLVRHLVEHPVLGPRLGRKAARLLVGSALAWRDWSLDRAEDGVSVTLTDGVLSLHLPGTAYAKVPNPVLADLLARRGCLTRASAAWKHIDKAVGHDVTDGHLVEQVDEDWVAVRWRLRERPRVEPTEVHSRDEQEPATAEPPRDELPREKPSKQELPAPEVPRPPMQPEGYRTTDDRIAELVHVLGNAGRLPRRELQRRLGWSRSTLRNVLEAAVDAGLIRTLAAHPRSPFQTYPVVHDPRRDHPQPPATTRWRRR